MNELVAKHAVILCGSRVVSLAALFWRRVLGDGFAMLL